MRGFKKDAEKLDAHGNWIKKISYFKKSAISISFREITYFDDESKSISLDILPNENVLKSADGSDANPAFTLNEEQIKWLTETGPAETFPCLKYFALVNKEFPFQYAYADNDVEVFALLIDSKLPKPNFAINEDS